ncbi:MAG TPA: hypothetical protein VEI01_00895 [Terriglobales bacterium]|nr:hypothetical protein [Terriglobales bacterium]
MKRAHLAIEPLVKAVEKCGWDGKGGALRPGPTAQVRGRQANGRVAELKKFHLSPDRFSWDEGQPERIPEIPATEARKGRGPERSRRAGKIAQDAKSRNPDLSTRPGAVPHDPRGRDRGH